LKSNSDKTIQLNKKYVLFIGLNKLNLDLTFHRGMGYDFSKLNDREFEVLGASIIEKNLNKRVERFKAGRDGGVDGRFWIGENQEGIIQCKRFIETSYTQLISKLKTDEAAKVKKLKPAKYIFITTKKLSRLNKQEIKRIFHPYIKREDDIWGEENLNDFLLKRENQDIVEQNIKLWITSTPVLDIIFNNAVKGRSESTIRDIEEHSHKYAITENHNRGLKFLKEKNVVLITGEPGIGKTTLADNLALLYVAKGYELCDIEENISEAEGLFREKEKKKILFYCDDFLGSNFYDAVSNKRDSHIVKFINRVRKDDSKKFILTSRTNILNKAYSLSSKFQNDKIRDNEFLLTVENLTELDKAQILYNHLYHSSLGKNYIDKVYENKRYKEIIKHRNFNPRIIEFIMDSGIVGDITPDKYWEYIQEKLDNPEDIWADYFQNQADDTVRALVFLTVFNNGRIAENKLQGAYSMFIKLHPTNLGDHSDKSFNAVRKLATKSLLNRSQIGEDHYEYTLFNPSIADFILGSYSHDVALITNILNSLETETSISFLNTISLTFNKKINDTTFQSVLLNLFEFFFDKKLDEEDWDFLILLAYLDFFNDKLEKKIELFLNTLVKTEYASGTKLSELILLLTEFEPKIEIEQFDFLHGFLVDNLDEDTLKELLDFIEKFEIKDKYILSQAESRVADYLNDVVNNNDLDIDFARHINHFSSPDGDTDFDIDTAGIESDIFNCLNSYLDDFNASTLVILSVDVSNIVSSLDPERMAIDYMESQDSDADDDMRGCHDNFSSNDDIDAVFERS